jgi:hypothetical protein
LLLPKRRRNFANYLYSSDHALSRITAAAKRREDLGDDAFRVEAGARIEFFGLS